MKIKKKSLIGPSFTLLFLALSIVSLAQASSFVCFTDISVPLGFNKLTQEPKHLPENFKNLDKELCFEGASINYKASIDDSGTISYNELAIGLEYDLGNMSLFKLFNSAQTINIVYTTPGHDGGLRPVIVAKLEKAMASNINLSFSGSNINQVSSSQEISLSYQKLYIDAYSISPATGESEKASSHCFDAVKNTTCSI